MARRGVAKVGMGSDGLAFPTNAWRHAVGELLVELQRIKSTGDRAALEQLVNRYASRFDLNSRDEMVARQPPQSPPEYVAIAPPLLRPIRDAAGRVVDARAEQTLDFDAYIDAVERASSE
jgi:dipeptidyl-peptidase-3